MKSHFEKNDPVIWALNAGEDTKNLSLNSAVCIHSPEM